MTTESTTRIHTGKIPMPGIASAIKPGSNAHRRPRIRKRARAVAMSSAHSKGGANVSQKEIASETAATPNARANCAREWRFVGVAGATGSVVTVVGVRVMVFSVCIEELLKLGVNTL